MRKVIISISAVLFIVVIIVLVAWRHRHVIPPLPAPAPAAMFAACTFTDSRGQTMRYRLCAPLHNDPARRYPLLLFLHGAYERGNDNLAQLDAIGPVVSGPAFRTRFPCYVLVPQCPPGSAWVNAHYAGGRFIPTRTPVAPMRLLYELLATLSQQLNIDADRRYVGGNSMGGSGTWDIITRYPGSFAAAFPMCGRGDTANAGTIAHLPIWVFHNTGDPLVDVRWSREMVATLRAHGGNPRFTEFSDKSHDCWTRALHDPEFFPWLFAQKRK